MANFEAWIADCHLKEFEADGEYKCQVAVWADCYDAFRDTLVKYLERRGLGILWLEEVLPAEQYFSRYESQQQQAGKLAQAVHVGNLVEIGRMVDIGETRKTEPEYYLNIAEHELKPLPDQSDIPFWDREWIAPELKDLLFGPLDKVTTLRTYFIADATLRKNITGIFDLDTVDVSVKCLFKGNAAEEMKEIAPYLIDMTLPDGAWENHDKVPAFHKDFFTRHWGQNTGIFIRTTALMSEVWGHFRRFTQVQVEEDRRWVYFRFWDPKVATYYFPSVRHSRKYVQKFFLKNDGGRRFQIIAEGNKGRHLTILSPKEDLFDKLNTPQPSFMFSKEDIKIFEGYMRDRFISDVAERAEAIWPHRRRAFDTYSDWKNEISTLTQEAQKKGLKLDRDIRDYISITLDKGKPFWKRKDVTELLSRPHLSTATQKMLALRHKLETGMLK